MKILSKANMSMKSKLLKKNIWKFKIIMNRIIRMSNCRKNGIKGIKYIKYKFLL